MGDWGFGTMRAVLAGAQNHHVGMTERVAELCMRDGFALLHEFISSGMNRYEVFG